MAQRKNIHDDEDEEDIPYNNIKKFSKSKSVKYTGQEKKRGKKPWRIRNKEE